MSLDTALRAAVKAVARSLGTAVTVRVITPGTYSTSSGGATDTSADTSVNGFLLTERDLRAFGLAMLGDRALLVPASSLSTEPVATRDRFLISTTVYRIVRADRVRGKNSQAAYILHGQGPA